MLARPGYIEEYVAFWSRREEINWIWASIYSPQVGEHSPEVLIGQDRQNLATQLLALRQHYPKFLIDGGMAKAFLNPPETPGQCLFSKMSVNYTADLRTRIEPCVLGGTPDCSQCGCAASVGLHSVKSVRLAGPLRIDHLVRGSLAIGRAVGKLRADDALPSRWQAARRGHSSNLVQVTSGDVNKAHD